MRATAVAAIRRPTLACLVLEGRSAYVWYRQAKIVFPEPGTADDTAYLRAVVAADKPPSPVTELLRGR